MLHPLRILDGLCPTVSDCVRGWSRATKAEAGDILRDMWSDPLHPSDASWHGERQMLGTWSSSCLRALTPRVWSTCDADHVYQVYIGLPSLAHCWDFWIFWDKWSKLRKLNIWLWHSVARLRQVSMDWFFQIFDPFAAPCQVLEQCWCSSNCTLQMATATAPEKRL